MKLTTSISFARSIPNKCESVLLMLVLVGCNSATATLPQATATPPQATATAPQATTTVSQTAATTPQVGDLFPLSQPGPYHVGTRTFTFEDASREGREVGVTIWYPAVQPAGSTDRASTRDADPDLSGAPYSLIMSSAKVGNIFAPHLASHGFVVAGVSKMDSAFRWGLWLIDYPLDIVFALDQIASSSPSGLEGMIDANHVGAMGYSFDGYNALALSGARVDPEFYSAQCAEALTMEPPPPAWWIEYICDLVDDWDKFVTRAGDTIPVSDDGLWQPMTHERIQAVMPMAPEGAWLFGERGLAAVNRPTLIIGAANDSINIYDLEAVYIFEHLGTPDRTMISFVGQGHMMIYDADPIARMAHFVTAFFGYHLQARNDYAWYFSKDFVAQHDDLAWGVYTGK